MNTNKLTKEDMKIIRLLQNIRTWPGNFDLMTDAFYIEEDRNPVEKERKETEMKDIMKTVVEVMIIIAAITIMAVVTQPPSTLGGTPM